MISNTNGCIFFATTVFLELYLVFSLIPAPDVRYCLNFMRPLQFICVCSSVDVSRCGRNTTLIACRNVIFSSLWLSRKLLFRVFAAPINKQLPGCSEILFVCCRFIFRFMWLRKVGKKLKSCLFFTFYENTLDEISIKIGLLYHLLNCIKTSILSKYGMAIFPIVVDIIL